MKQFDPLDKIEYVQDTIVTEILLSDKDNSVTLLALDGGTELNTHISETDACVYILEGDIEFTFGMEKFNLSTGGMLTFEKNIPHSLTAVKRSKMLLIKI